MEMDIDLYFDKPGELPSDFYFLPEAESFKASLVAEDYDVAIIGAKSELNSANCGAALAPDAIRKYLYTLRGGFDKLRICDLGNIKKGNKPTDIRFALRDVIAELHARKITTVVIGGTQDLTVSIFDGLKENINEISVSVIDAKADLRKEPEAFNSFTFINQLLEDERLSRLDLLGYQNYYCSNQQLEVLKERNFFGFRVGSLRGDMGLSEPIFRDCDLLSLDMSVVRQSDAPGNGFPSSNGFFGEEICQLARFAGFSDRISAFGLFEVNPYFDNNDQTSALAAQVIWHFIEALNSRYGDYPAREIDTYKKYVIPDLIGNDDMVFYNNNLNNRWWIEIPTLKGKRIFSCMYEDYRLASINQVPDIWMKYYLK